MSESTKKVELTPEQLSELSREDLLERFMKQTEYAEELEKQLKKKDEAPVPGMQQEATRREKFLVMRLTAKESESHDYLNQLEELRYSVATGYRHTHLDPAVNIVFDEMKQSHFQNQLEELRYSVATGYRHTHLDPAVNIVFDEMKQSHFQNQLEELRYSVATGYRHTHLDPAVNIVFDEMKQSHFQNQLEELRYSVATGYRHTHLDPAVNIVFDEMKQSHFQNQLEELRYSVATGYRHTHLDPAVNIVFDEMKQSHFQNQLEELRCSVATGYRHTHLDPAVNIVFDKMKQKLEEHKKDCEQAQEELSAWKFTPDSTTGKRLMSKCRLLLTENAELGQMVSSGRIGQLEGDIALSRNTTSDIENMQKETDALLISMDEEMEGLQSVIIALQQKLGSVVSVSGEDVVMSDAESAVTAPPVEPGFIQSPLSNGPPESAPMLPRARLDTVTPPAPSLGHVAHYPSHKLGGPMEMTEAFDPTPHPKHAETDQLATGWVQARTFAPRSGQNSGTSTPDLMMTAAPVGRLATVQNKFEPVSAGSTPPVTDAGFGQAVMSVSPPSNSIGQGETSGMNSATTSNSAFLPLSGIAAVSSHDGKCRTPTPPAPGDGEPDMRTANGPTLPDHMDGGRIPSPGGAMAATGLFISTMDDPKQSTGWTVPRSSDFGGRTTGEEHPAVPVSNYGDHQARYVAPDARAMAERTDAPEAPLPPDRISPPVANFSGSNSGQGAEEVAADPLPHAHGHDKPPERKKRRKNIPAAPTPPGLTDPYNSSKYTTGRLGGRNTRRQTTQVRTPHVPEDIHLNGGGGSTPTSSGDDNAAGSSGAEEPIPPQRGFVNGQAPPPPIPPQSPILHSSARGYDPLDAEED